jgi:hypothetical protein
LKILHFHARNTPLTRIEVPVFDSKTMTTTNTRRSFITTAAGTVAAPFILPGRIWSADASPNGKIRMGFIGMGKQMGGLISRFLQYPEVEVVAVCDVYAAATSTKRRSTTTTPRTAAPASPAPP